MDGEGLMQQLPSSPPPGRQLAFGDLCLSQASAMDQRNTWMRLAPSTLPAWRNPVSSPCSGTDFPFGPE